MSTKEWLSDRLESPEFQRLLEREDFIERYLDEIESLMDEKGVSRSELARRMGCSRANITQMFRRTKNLTAESMVDLAFQLGCRIRCRLEALTRTQLPESRSSQPWLVTKDTGMWAAPRRVSIGRAELELDLIHQVRSSTMRQDAADNTEYALVA